MAYKAFMSHVEFPFKLTICNLFVFIVSILDLSKDSQYPKASVVADLGNGVDNVCAFTNELRAYKAIFCL